MECRKRFVAAGERNREGNGRRGGEEDDWLLHLIVADEVSDFRNHKHVQHTITQGLDESALTHK